MNNPELLDSHCFHERSELQASTLATYVEARSPKYIELGDVRQYHVICQPGHAPPRSGPSCLTVNAAADSMVAALSPVMWPVTFTPVHLVS